MSVAWMDVQAARLVFRSTTIRGMDGLEYDVEVVEIPLDLTGLLAQRSVQKLHDSPAEPMPNFTHIGIEECFPPTGRSLFSCAFRSKRN